MAFYGNQFLTPDQAGPASALSPEHVETASEIGFEWLTNALDSTRTQDAGNAQLELEALAADGADLQGIGAVGGSVIAALDHIPWLSQAGLAGVARLNKTLGQVVRYLNEPDIRAYAIDKVCRHLETDTCVVIGHSLGAVVAYEAIRSYNGQLPLLITLGSPLGLSAVNRRLQKPPAFPSGLTRWVNLADRDDIVAARPHQTEVFTVNRPPWARLDSTYTVDNGSSPHRANFYLTKRDTGQAIADGWGTDQRQIR